MADQKDRFTKYRPEIFEKTEEKQGNIHKYYQFEALNKSLVGVKLNVVVLIVIDKKNKISRNVWFSNDLQLNYEVLLEYYSLRFQTVRRCDRIPFS